MRKTTKTTIAAAALAFAITGLTGCAGGGQSVAEACKVFSDEATKIASEAQGLVSEVGSDPDAATKALGDVQSDFEKLGDKITNEEVKSAYDDFVAAYGEFTEIIGSVAEDPANASEAMEKISDATTAISDAGSKMQEVCK